MADINPAKTWGNEDLTPTDLNAEFSNVYSNHVSKSTAQTISGIKTHSAAIILQDSVNLTFGTGSDATIDYDGTNLVVDPAVVGSGVLSLQGGLTVGVDDTGHDVQLFGATSGAHLLWDESADTLKLVGGAATNMQGTLTVGVDDTGYDVTFYGATSGANMLWDESADTLILSSGATLSVDDTTDSTSGTTGSIHTDGGVGIAKDLYVGNDINLADTGVINFGAAVSLTQGSLDDLTFSASRDGNFAYIMDNPSATNPFGVKITTSGATIDSDSVRFLDCVDATTVRFRVMGDGDAENHDNDYGGISDERLKQNIVDSSSQWDDIKNIQVRKYKFISDVEAYGDDAETHLGVVAQEVLQVSPGLVHYHEAEDTYSVKYSILYMKAVKALQECMARIEALEAA